MAVRLSATGQDFSRSLALGSLTALTASFWWKVSVDRNTYSTAFFVDNGQADNWGVQTGVDGTTANVILDGNSTPSVAMTVGTWYFGCLALSGTTGTFYYKAAGSAALSTTGITGVTSTNGATLRLGESPWGSEWLNGCLAAFKLWSAQLTADEIQAESMQYVPNRLANLVSWHPFVKTELTDYSGNTRTLSGGTGTATEDGPPVAWRANVPKLILPASAAASASGASSTTQRSATTDAGAKSSSGSGTAAQHSATTDAGSKKGLGVGTAAQRSQTAATVRKQGAAVGASVARCTTSCTGVKGTASPPSVAQQSQTAAVGSKAASGAGASLAHPLTQAGSSVGGAGRTAQRSATTCSGVRGAVGTGMTAVRPVSGSSALKSGTTTGVSVSRCTVSGTGRKGGSAVGASVCRLATTGSGMRRAIGAAGSACRTAAGSGGLRAASSAGQALCHMATASTGTSTPIPLRDVVLVATIESGRFGGTIAEGPTGSIEAGRWKGSATW